MYENLRSVQEPGAALPALVQLEAVSKRFRLASGDFSALSDVTLRVRPGCLVAITGSSGSGKSTLLNLIAGLDRPTSGDVKVAGTNLAQLDESALARFRGVHVGVVFQFFQLLPTLTALENVLLAMDLVGVIAPEKRGARALELLSRVGVAEQAHKFPSALSGGQQQRVAIARALANDPPLIVADEPSGNLDSQSARVVFSLLESLVVAGKTVLVVTHERPLPVAVHQTIELRDGRVVPTPVPAELPNPAEPRGLECTA